MSDSGPLDPSSWIGKIVGDPTASGVSGQLFLLALQEITRALKAQTQATQTNPFRDGSPSAYAITVGAASAQCIAAGVAGSRASLYFFNASASDDIWICPALKSGGAALAAAVNGAGSVRIPPLTGLPISGAAYQAWNAISTAASSPLTIWEFAA